MAAAAEALALRAAGDWNGGGLQFRANTRMQQVMLSGVGDGCDRYYSDV